MNIITRAARTLLPALLCLVSFSSCLTTKYYLQPSEEDYDSVYKYWNETNIIAEQGQPTRIEPIADGGKIIVYEEYKPLSEDVGLAPTNSGVDLVDANGNVRHYLEFYLGNDGRCYQVKSNRPRLVAKKERSHPTKKSLTWGITGTSVILAAALYFIIQEVK